MPIIESFQLSLTFAIPLSLAAFAFTKTFRKYPSLLTITIAKLDSLIIISSSGIPLFAYDFKEREGNLDGLAIMLGSVLSTFNISLCETLDSDSSLLTIAFQNKVILIDSEYKFSIYLICSENNIIIADLITLFAQRFTQRFSIFMDKELGLTSKEKFRDFSKIVEVLAQFAPLCY
ncbi:MAG: hypothetical protein EAX86_03195 [Candidatus Heimdallarchaeota archaeon]|nr:hypothetical protein [Candidatus Heimdallarchaeota archaeon]